MSSTGGDVLQAVELKLFPSSVLKIQKGDITRWSVDGSSDAIVNPANECLEVVVVLIEPYIELLVQNYEQHDMRSQK